jgi:hypothetical protein
MPTYTFRNKDTGEQFDQFMGISAREDYLKQNPHLETIITGTPATIDPVRLGITKSDAGFKEVLQRIHEKTAGSQLNKTTRQL